MPEEDEYHNEFSYMPTEVVFHILSLLPVKDLFRCRQVCQRWQQIIDDLSKSDALWHRRCEHDFSSVYLIAREKCKPTLKWYNLYRSLTLWQQLENARENMDEFASASDYNGEVRNVIILRDGLIAVHTRAAIVYYNSDTLEPAKRGPITGDYMKYIENDQAIVVTNFLNLYVVRKYFYNARFESTRTFDNVKSFFLTDFEVYYVTLQDEIFLVQLTDEVMLQRRITVSEDGIMCLGYSDQQLNILTFERNIYKLVGNDMVFVCTLGPDSNLLHQLRKYNFLEQLDWRVYFQWMFVLCHAIPEGPLRDIIVVRSYGDVVFVGSNWGVLRIYYAPYSSGEFNLFNAEPVKQYNFMERIDCPVLSMCPIIQIDVMESDDGHVVFVAMPKKVAVLEFTHSFKRTASVAMLPFADIEKVKVLKLN